MSRTWQVPSDLMSPGSGDCPPDWKMDEEEYGRLTVTPREPRKSGEACQVAKADSETDRGGTQVSQTASAMP